MQATPPAEHWFNEGYQQLYFWMQLPNPRPTVYSKGKVYKGTGSITSMPLSAPADGIITGILTLPLTASRRWLTQRRSSKDDSLIAVARCLLLWLYGAARWCPGRDLYD
jgi:hypothetical protein